MDLKGNTGSISRISRGETFVFWVILLFIVVVTPVIMSEWLVYSLGYHVPNDPYLYFGRVSPFFTKLRIDGKLHYKVTHREVYRERNVLFPLEKENGEFRVFCLGGSASAGWPHPPDEIYSAYLQEALRKTFPGRKINVINVSAHAYAAYRVRLIFEEIMEFHPDLIILYSGNNEFIEKRKYRVRERWYEPIRGVADRLAVFRLLRGSPLVRRIFAEDTLQGDQREHVPYEHWSKILQVPLDLRKDPKQFRRVKEHYSFSIRSIVQGATQEGIPVILVTVPVNLRDWQPNVSYRSTNGKERARLGERIPERTDCPTSPGLQSGDQLAAQSHRIGSESRRFLFPPGPGARSEREPRRSARELQPCAGFRLQPFPRCFGIQ